MLKTSLCDVFGINIPIILAPMGTSAEFAAAGMRLQLLAFPMRMGGSSPIGLIARSPGSAQEASAHEYGREKLDPVTVAKKLANKVAPTTAEPVTKGGDTPIGGRVAADACGRGLGEHARRGVGYVGCTARRRRS